MENLLYTIIIGAIIGWLAGFLRKGYGFGVIGNIIVGIAGAWFGSWLFGMLGVSLLSGTIGYILQGVIGALALLFLIGLIRR